VHRRATTVRLLFLSMTGGPQGDIRSFHNLKSDGDLSYCLATGRKGKEKARHQLLVAFGALNGDHTWLFSPPSFEGILKIIAAFSGNDFEILASELNSVDAFDIDRRRCERIAKAIGSDVETLV
jgi:hypothetical protein